jgi:hypothetical protein
VSNKPLNSSKEQQPQTNPAEESLSRVLWLKIGLLLFFGIVADLDSSGSIAEVQRNREASV